MLNKNDKLIEKLKKLKSESTYSFQCYIDSAIEKRKKTHLIGYERLLDVAFNLLMRATKHNSSLTKEERQARLNKFCDDAKASFGCN
jgi:hypothetical protein